MVKKKVRVLLRTVGHASFVTMMLDVVFVHVIFIGQFMQPMKLYNGK